MKKVVGGWAALALLFVVASCGGVSESDLVGKWTVDPSSVDVTFGDNVPSKYQKEFNAEKKNMVSRAGDEAENMVLEFKEDGKFTVGSDEFAMEGNWSLKGEDLTLSMDFMGEKLEVTAQVEMDGDKMIATLQASEILKRVKKMDRMADELDEIEAEEDLDKMAEGTSFSVAFTKK